MSWKDLPVLVTGAQGFIGAWLAERLLDEGARVIAPRRDVNAGSRFRSEGIEERCDLVQLDIADYPALLRVLHEYRVRAVFHLASQSIADVAQRSPYPTWEANIRGTYTVLEACRAARELGEDIDRIVVASSVHAYGPPLERPFREDDPLRPLHPYAVSKAAADTIARSYAVTHGLPVAALRLANVYGGGDLSFSRLVPDACRALVAGDAPVLRSDGTPERELVYVEDAVAAYLAVAESLHDDKLAGAAWNAGSGEVVPVLEVVRRLIRAAGADVEPDVRGEAGPRADRQELDSTAIRTQLGWEPAWDLDRGLAATYEWYVRASERDGAT
ncbi:MAG: NAD-dependent epimerase/dehydratase family protein [Actinomycetota bacterium]|nr:NAD-dependent epimerase/dehydratase family protein [Actinomycetota bacterium]